MLSNWWHFIEKIIWISILFCFSSFLPLSFFCPFILLHYCRCSLLCPACLLLLMTVLYSPLFSSLVFVLLYVVFLFVFLFGYAPYCVLSGNKKNHDLFPSLSLLWALCYFLGWCSSPVLFSLQSILPVSFPLLVLLILSLLIMAFIFSESFWNSSLLPFQDFSQLLVPESTYF